MKFLALTLFGLLAVSLVEAAAVRDVKSDLIAKGEKLIKEADAAVQKLTGALKAQEAAIVKTEEARIKQLVADLEAAATPAAITRLEGELNQAEQKLAFEIQKVNKEAAPKPNPVTRDLKSDLITKGNDLIKKADEAVAKLNGAQKVAEAAIVKAEEAQIKRLIAELEAITVDGPTLLRVERELQAAEAKLAAEVAKISNPVVNPPTGDQKAALIAKGQALIKQADEAVAKLNGAQKVAEAAIVKAEEAQIKRLIAELEAITVDGPTLLRVERELQVAEAKLAAEVAKISKTPVVPVPAF